MSASLKTRAYLLAAILLPALAPCVFASSSALPTLPKQDIRLLDNAKDMQNKHVAQPDEPGTDCVREVSAADKLQARSADFAASTGNEAKDLRKCLPQADAFTRAGEAASYLGHYFRHFTPFAQELYGMTDEKRAEFHESIRQCVTDSPNCNEEKKRTLLKALVQYNFGKDLRSQVLANNARAERMKTASSNLSDEYWRSMRTTPQRVMTSNGALRTGSLRTTTFRLDAKKDYVLDWNKFSSDERAVLGNNFMNEYRFFMENYSKTTEQKSRWHYVSAKSAAFIGNTFRAADDFKSQDSKLGTLAVDRNRLEADSRSQDTQRVNDIVFSYRNSTHDLDVVSDRYDDNGTKKRERVPWANTRPNDILVRDTGFGLQPQKDPRTDEIIDPKVVAQGMILSINKAIVSSEETLGKENNNDREPSSSATAISKQSKIIPSISVDIQKFDQFLDAIWPADVAKPKS